ncbi:UDP-N-acetylmuramate dehydrogenase [Parashewanella hymeniacidonis]|uniref:UDP-N-acetylmuramate dehydrogenase n=1 Tax=Parashewanella hymeniacidonis TaxID=2807618 RepID=UPI001EF4F6B3|nr:UDP-N-acetylmuramate dehydrogenase [Parashewanella hymeniacidonis]
MSGTAHSLTEFNTLGLMQGCQQLQRLNSTESIIEFCRVYDSQSQPLLVLGGGSNLVLTDDLEGTVIKIESKGICLSEDNEYHYLSVAAGEDWSRFVASMVNQGINGLENLALIPGTVGAAPIQNIGAYGVEFEKVCDWVEFYHLQHKTVTRLTAAECQFGYRDSIFKNALKNQTVILRVGFKLTKHWQPVVNYGPLSDFNVKTITANDIFKRVCEIRQSKLPDPKVIGNVGSFFKNPVVSTECHQNLLKRYPDMVAYLVDNGVKLAAGWLIDQAGLKGYKQGNVGVHDKQALVLVNHGGATGTEIVNLASYVTATVLDKFGVELEVEPRFIGKHGEIEFHG